MKFVLIVEALDGRFRRMLYEARYAPSPAESTGLNQGNGNEFVWLGYRCFDSSKKSLELVSAILLSTDPFHNKICR